MTFINVLYWNTMNERRLISPGDWTHDFGILWNLRIFHSWTDGGFNTTVLLTCELPSDHFPKVKISKSKQK